jgi:hypothetical protein
MFYSVNSGLKYIYSLLITLLSIVGMAQETLPKYIAEDLVLKEGVYIVEGVVYARANTTFKPFKKTLRLNLCQMPYYA